VRYRLDAMGQRRSTTEELVVDEAPAARREKTGTVTVRIACTEAELRSRARAAGGQWDASRKLRRMPSRVARQIGLADRIVEEFPDVEVDQ
jgi:hypothetical protein